MARASLRNGAKKLLRHAASHNGIVSSLCLPSGKTFAVGPDRVVALNFHEDILRFGSSAAQDFRALAANVDAVLLKGVPQLSKEHQDAARRFSLLIEALYERRALLVCDFEVEPNAVFDMFARQRSLAVANPQASGSFVRRSCSEHHCGGCTWSTFGAGRCGVIETSDWGSVETGFAAERASSRLAEMGSSNYVSKSRPFSGR